MVVLLSLIVGLIYAMSIYMILRRSVVKLIIGLALLGHGANLLIYTAGMVDASGVRGNPPLITEGSYTLGGEIARTVADPLPPALILTAIVISFAIVAFAAVLVKRAYQEVGTDDLDKMISTDLA
ncbi:MAG: NADH-quinone oxidoreductase subunit K [Planctomycetota bacterium]